MTAEKKTEGKKEKSTEKEVSKKKTMEAKI